MQLHDLSSVVSNLKPSFKDYAVSNTLVDIDSEAVGVFGLNIYNRDSSVLYLRLFNDVSGNLTLGSDAPQHTIQIPASEPIFVPPRNIALLEFDTGLAIAATASGAETSGDAPTTGLSVELWYQHFDPSNN